MKCVISVLREYSSSVSICRTKGTQSDLGALILTGPPDGGEDGGPSSGSAAKISRNCGSREVLLPKQVVLLRLHTLSKNMTF